MARFITVFVIVVALGGLWQVHGAYQADLDAAHARVATGSEVVATDCGPIEYAESGSGAPVLVVHGAGGGFDQGLGFGEDLAQHGFRIIAMSRFGYLRTPLPEDASAAAQADALACLLDALGIERAAVLGASAGAPSSLQLALRHPDRITALGLLVPATYVPRAGGVPAIVESPETAVLFETALRWDFLFWAALRAARGLVLEAVLATPTQVVEQADADEQARVQWMLEQPLPVSLRRRGLVNDGLIISTLPRYALERIDTPALIIGTADDRFGTYEAGRYTAAQMPNARFIGYPTGGHLLVGRHADVIDELATFLDDYRSD